ncbi:hypothetical protein [Actinocorallia populi]|uniref:hypothetical protein n=1 Tax=Actinocorallia populi TaxID=2079200 RepID=UPI000D09347A|nr:hypothetical protein [Actinocorallia populi]
MNETDEAALVAAARRVADRHRAETGIDALRLRPSAVPSFVTALLPYAEILGVGDDGTRDSIFAEVPPAFLNLVRDAIGHAPGLFDWYRQAETTKARNTPEVAAIGWMLRGLNLG